MRQKLSLATCLLAGSLAAQSVVVPSIANSKPGNGSLHYVFFGTPSTQFSSESHILSLYDANDISLASGTLRSLQVRRSTSIPFNNPATTVTLEVTMSRTQTASDSIQDNFAANHDAATKVTVFRGNVNLPARGVGSWPEPWEAKIPFSNSFAWIKNGTKSLAVEIKSSNNTAKRTWYVEGYEAENGSQRTELSPFHCQHSGGTSNNGILTSATAIGKPWSVDHLSMPGNTPSLRASVNALGMQGAGGVFSGHRLPVQVSRLGIPSQPNCQLAIDILTTLPMTYVPSTRRNGGALKSPSIVIPNDRALVDQVFYSQPICIDTHPVSRRPLIYTGWALKWTIGSGEAPAGSSVFRIGANSNPSGFTQPGVVPSFRLDS